MSELFLELFSEEIPVSLQKDIREKLILDIQKSF
jgi:glycyl-tRNA synthetase beta chain